MNYHDAHQTLTFGSNEIRTAPTKAGRLAALLLAAVFVGCGAPGADPDLAAESHEEINRAAEEQLKSPYLPYGVPVPEGEIVSALPEPYDPARHGPPTQNPMPEANRADAPDVPRDFDQRKHGSVKPPIFPPGTGDRGFWVNTGTGIFAVNDVQTNLAIPDSSIGTTIYAPTHLPAGGSCIETVMAHWRPGVAATGHGHGFWDWCRVTPGWGVFESITAAWQSAYVRSINGENRYNTQVNKTSATCWQGLLYNYNTGTWDVKLTSCGTTKTGFGNTGWTMWESWNLIGCPVFPDIKAQSIQILTSTGWQSLAPAHTGQLGPSAGSCFAAGTYTFTVPVANSAWEALTP